MESGTGGGSDGPVRASRPGARAQAGAIEMRGARWWIVLRLRRLLPVLFPQDDEFGSRLPGYEPTEEIETPAPTPAPMPVPMPVPDDPPGPDYQ